MEKILKDKRIKNTWAVIPIKDLPADIPVLGVSKYPNKSFAEFHLVEYCLIPKEIEQKLTHRKIKNKVK